MSLRPDSQCSGAVGTGWVITEIGLSTKLCALAGENVYSAFVDAFGSNLNYDPRVDLRAQPHVGEAI